MSSSPAEQASALKERVYVAFTSLAVVVAVRGNSHAPEAGAAVRTLVLTVLGTVIAVFLADVTAHLVAHRQPANQDQMRRIVRRSFGGFLVAIAPIICLLGAVTAWWSADVALASATVSLLATLCVIGYIAVRRLPIPRWQKAVALAGQTCIGLVIIAVDFAAHQ